MTNAYLYVLDTLADWEPGFLTAELNTGRMFKEPGAAVPVRTAGATRDPITTLGGMRVVPDLALSELTPADAAVLILPGGNTWSDQLAALDKAREFLAAGVPVAAICGATIAMANAGLLDDRPHTSNNLDLLKAVCPGYRGAAHYVEAPVVADGDLITATGTAPLEFARAVFERLDVMSPEALAAWYQLNKTSEARYYFELMQAIPQPA